MTAVARRRRTAAMAGLPLLVGASIVGCGCATTRGNHAVRLSGPTPSWSDVQTLARGTAIVVCVDGIVEGGPSARIAGELVEANDDGLILRARVDDFARVFETADGGSLFLSEDLWVRVPLLRRSGHGAIEIGLLRRSVRLAEAAIGPHRGRRGALIGALSYSVATLLANAAYGELSLAAAIPVSILLSPLGAIPGYLVGRRFNEYRTVYERQEPPARRNTHGAESRTQGVEERSP